MEITAPWLTQEMVYRIASTLNYFLMHLTGAPGVSHSNGCHASAMRFRANPVLK